MAGNTHSTLTGAELHVPGYVQNTDPGAVGAGKLWIDTTLGTMKWAVKLRNAGNTAWQSVGGVAADIDSGTIDGTTIGATVPATGKFTTLTASAEALYVDAAAGTNRVVRFRSAGVERFVFYVDGVGESGANAGSNFQLAGYSDLGAFLGNWMSITRANGKVTFAGDLAHGGTNLGFYNVTPTARPAAYTQTYATPTRTHSNPTATALTAASGTADGTVADVGASFNQTTLNNNFKDIATVVNALIVDVANVKQIGNQIIDDLQLVGLLQ